MNVDSYRGAHRLEDAMKQGPLPLPLLKTRAAMLARMGLLLEWAVFYRDGLHDLHRGRDFIGAGHDLYARDRMLKAMGRRRGARVDAERAA